MSLLQRLAPAKINLHLHITGKREDGYHLLDSMVVFGQDACDTLTFTPSDVLSLTVEGRGAPPEHNNIILKAAHALQYATATRHGAAFHLNKQLPMGGGIGGGSADAAAALHLMNEGWKLDVPEEKLATIGLTLGADVPVCTRGKACRMQGIGEVLMPVMIPELYAVLVNPNVHVNTAEMFRAGVGMTAPAPPLPEPHYFLEWLREQHNDFQPHAIARAPVIGEVLEEIAHTPSCIVARMSGSGSTCFGVYSTMQQAELAATLLRAHSTDWWIVPTRLK